LVDVWLPYGDTEVCLRVPTRNLIETLESKEARGVDDPRAEVEKAIENPVGAERLSELAKPDMKVAIVVKNSKEADAQINRTVLEALLKELREAGVEDRRVKVLVAYDPTSPDRSAGIEAITAGEILKGVDVKLHDPEGDSCVEVGGTQSGNIRLNRAFVEADLKVTVGFVELHPYAGYGGGREAILPGIADEKTVQSNLALALNPNARMGILDGNPVHEDMVEASRLVDVDFAVNVVRNSRGEVLAAFSGSLDESFMRGVKLLEDMYAVQVERRADVVFLSPGGAPHDRNLCTASLGVMNGLEFLKRGGTFVLVAECLEGCGEESFHAAVKRFKKAEALKRRLKRRFTFGGYVAYLLMRAMERSRIRLVSVLPDHYALEIFGSRVHRTVNEALRHVLGEVGRNAKITVIKSGNTVVPAPAKEE